jgi:uncharacterized protein (TIGR03083 family)
MGQLRPVRPVHTTGLFRPLHRELIALLRDLDPTDWDRPTTAGDWNVRQVVAHLLHDDLRELSATRLEGETGSGEVGFAELVALIDEDNARGVEFLSTLGPGLLTDLLGFTGLRIARLFEGLVPNAPAATNVAWAGEAVSANWTDVGREFTECWHHQMQIRDAVGAPGLTGRRWVEPILRLSVLALRRAYAGVEATPGTSVVLRVRGDWAHTWTVTRGAAGWDLLDGAAGRPVAAVSMDVHEAWRSLFNFRSTEETYALADIAGDERLAVPILSARSVMISEAIEQPGPDLV